MPSPTFLRGSMANTKEEDVDDILQEIQALETKAELLESKLEAAEAEEAAEEKDCTKIIPTHGLGTPRRTTRTCWTRRMGNKKKHTERRRSTSARRCTGSRTRSLRKPAAAAAAQQGH